MKKVHVKINFLSFFSIKDAFHVLHNQSIIFNIIKKKKFNEYLIYKIKLKFNIKYSILCAIVNLGLS